MSRMRLTNLYYELDLHDWLESLLPDFVLAFAFFTSISFAVLGRQFEHKRSAIAMSVSIGFALSIGLVWWEEANDLSIRNLGPIAIGFAVLVLSLVMYRSIKHVMGTWAGAGITIGVCILIAQLLEIKAPVNPEIIQTVTVVALIVGIIAFLSHNRSSGYHIPSMPAIAPDIRHDIADLYRNRHLSDQLSHRIRKVRKQADSLTDHPADTGNVLVQLKKMLPAQGYLTERMAQLRAKAHQIRNGHIARLEETQYVFSKLPVSARKKASAELAAQYNQLIGIDTRLERLDKAVAENERRIRELTAQAQQYTARYDYRKLTDALKAAEKLQRHNSKLFKIIGHTEDKLTAIARKIAQGTRKVNTK